MIRPLVAAFAIAAGFVPVIADPVAAQARQVCFTIMAGGTDGWGSIHCTVIDRPRDLPARLRR